MRAQWKCSCNSRITQLHRNHGYWQNALDDLEMVNWEAGALQALEWSEIFPKLRLTPGSKGGVCSLTAKCKPTVADESYFQLCAQLLALVMLPHFTNVFLLSILSWDAHLSVRCPPLTNSLLCRRQSPVRAAFLFDRSSDRLYQHFQDETSESCWNWPLWQD